MDMKNGIDSSETAVKRKLVVMKVEKELLREIDAGREFLRIWAVSELGEFCSLNQLMLRKGRIDSAGLKEPEILENLRVILEKGDKKWRLGRVEFLSVTALRLWFGEVSRPQMSLENSLILDWTGLENVAFQIRQSTTPEERPYRKFFYKMKVNQVSELELVVVCWEVGAKMEVYRFYPQRDLKTVEWYPEGANLLLKDF